MSDPKFDVNKVKVPTGKVLVKLSKNHSEEKIGDIYLPNKNSSKVNEGIVIAIGNYIDNTYYDYDYKKRREINVEVGDIVTLSFVTKFTQFTVDKDQYLCINPSVITSKCCKSKYYNDL